MWRSQILSHVIYRESSEKSKEESKEAPLRMAMTKFDLTNARLHAVVMTPTQDGAPLKISNLHSHVLLKRDGNLAAVNHAFENVVVVDKNRTLQPFLNEDECVMRKFDTEFEYMSKYKLMGGKGTRGWSKTIRAFQIFPIESDDSVLDVQLVGVVTLANFAIRIHRFTDTQVFTPTTQASDITNPNGLFLEGLCRFGHGKNGIGKVLVNVCIQESRSQRKDLYLSVFNHKEDANVMHSHQKLYAYYVSLGFIFIAEFKHNFSNVHYTLMMYKG
jgi:hypothetical protein